MIKLDGMNLYSTGYKHLTINGAHITATNNTNTPEDIRTSGHFDDNWYDTKHAFVMEKVADLEKAIKLLLA